MSGDCKKPRDWNADVLPHTWCILTGENTWDDEVWIYYRNDRNADNPWWSQYSL